MSVRLHDHSENRLSGRAQAPIPTSLPQRLSGLARRWPSTPSRGFALAAVAEGEAELRMIPIENSIAGLVADIHHLLPSANLHVVGEYFCRSISSCSA